MEAKPKNNREKMSGSRLNSDDSSGCKSSCVSKRECPPEKESEAVRKTIARVTQTVADIAVNMYHFADENTIENIAMRQFFMQYEYAVPHQVDEIDSGDGNTMPVV
ncbi:hypothetical protein Fot_22170 [Forsythia ovata]|uniref:Uncharacterized protein n=1 Tax=Forsythia ovata TaxID=205694 RepID=A0ABD1UWZ2_9LAMI